MSSSVLMSRSKNVAFFPLYSSFSGNPPGYMHLSDSENSSSCLLRKCHL